MGFLHDIGIMMSQNLIKMHQNILHGENFSEGGEKKSVLSRREASTMGKIPKD